MLLHLGNSRGLSGATSRIPRTLSGPQEAFRLRKMYWPPREKSLNPRRARLSLAELVFLRLRPLKKAGGPQEKHTDLGKAHADLRKTHASRHQEKHRSTSGKYMATSGKRLSRTSGKISEILRISVPNLGKIAPRETGFTYREFSRVSRGAVGGAG